MNFDQILEMVFKKFTNQIKQQGCIPMASFVQTVKSFGYMGEAYNDIVKYLGIEADNGYVILPDDDDPSVEGNFLIQITQSGMEKYNL